MPPRRILTPEEKAEKVAKQRERRQNESPDVRKRRLAQQKEYQLEKYNREKRCRLNTTEPEGGAAQSDGRAEQADLAPRVQERAAFSQPNDGGADQRQELDGIGVPLEAATEVLNDNDTAQRRNSSGRNRNRACISRGILE
jgi:hypothetical protein